MNDILTVDDIMNGERLEVTSTYPNYKVYKDSKVYGVKEYPMQEVEKKNIFSNLALSEVFFLRKLKDRENFPSFVTIVKGDNVLYMVTDWVDSDTLSDILKSPNDPDMLQSIYKQLFLLFTFLRTDMGIIHGDSLPQNILLKKIPATGYIKYTFLGKSWFFKNYGYLPVIWDFGVSRTIKGKGYDKVEQIVKKENVSEDLIDVFKMVDAVRHSVYTQNNWFYLYIRNLWIQYTEEGLDKVLEDCVDPQSDVLLSINL